MDCEVLESNAQLEGRHSNPPVRMQAVSGFACGMIKSASG
jgi:hypothetical protein